MWWVGKNLVVETPIHLLFISPGETPTISQPRCLVAESGSVVTLIEDYTNRQEESAKEEERVYLTNTVTEIWIEENAQVSILELNGKVMRRFILGGVRSLKPVIVAIPAMPLLWAQSCRGTSRDFPKG